MELVSGNIFLRENVLPKAGDFVDGHTHNFDHTSFVIKGSVRVEGHLPNGTPFDRTFTAGQHFLVRKDVHHKITAMEDDTLFHCIYSHRTPQGDVVQEANGWGPAYV